MTERRLWAILGILVAAGAVLGLFLERPRRFRPALAADLPSPQSQETRKRTLEPAPLELLARVAAEPGGLLVRPRLVQAGEDGSVWLFDYSELALKRVAPGGAVETLELTPGEGDPGLRNPTDLARSPEGGLWLPDPAAERLHSVAPDGTLLRSLPTSSPALRWVISPSGRAFALTPMAGGSIFQAFDDPDGPPVARFGSLLEPSYQMPYTLDGSLAAGPAGGFVYAPRYVGLLASYRSDGTLTFLVETLDRVGPPELIRESGRLRGDPEAPTATLAVQVVGDAVLAVHAVEGLDGPAFVDLYSAADGSYLRSWPLDRPWLDFDVRDGLLHAVTTGGLESYRMTAEP